MKREIFLNFYNVYVRRVSRGAGEGGDFLKFLQCVCAESEQRSR